MEVYIYTWEMQRLDTCTCCIHTYTMYKYSTCSTTHMSTYMYMYMDVYMYMCICTTLKRKADKLVTQNIVSGTDIKSATDPSADVIICQRQQGAMPEAMCILQREIPRGYTAVVSLFSISV